jgi:hypothetical protein
MGIWIQKLGSIFVFSHFQFRCLSFGFWNQCYIELNPCGLIGRLMFKTLECVLHMVLCTNAKKTKIPIQTAESNQNN